MWLSGGSKPDIRTINYFRGKLLGEHFSEIFSQVVELLHTEGFVSLQVQNIGGTKIESAANKYSFVWRGSIEKNDAKLREKTKAILVKAEEAAGLYQYEKNEAETLMPDDFKERLARIKKKIDTPHSLKNSGKPFQKWKTSAFPDLTEYPELLQRIPLKDLAAYLAVTSQSLSRIRAKIK